MQGPRSGGAFPPEPQACRAYAGRGPKCIGQNPSPELRGLLDKAGKALKAHVGAAHQSEVSESNLDLAEQLWQARKKECKSPPAGDSPLALVLARLAQ